MGCETSTSTSGATGGSSPAGKRGRDPEDEAYLDNFHSHKRYLSEMMASSLNGLTVGDTLTENLMESPARSDTTCYLRDDICPEYSLMLEDSDDSRYYDTSLPPAITQSDVTSVPTSPVSPHRFQKTAGGLSSNNPYPLSGCTLATVVCCHSRQRGSESEGRFPSSPNDMCHTADLRRAALLRSVQMRTQPHSSPSYELQYNSDQENIQCDEERENGEFSGIKNSVDETEYQGLEQGPNLFVESSTVGNHLGTELDCEKKCNDFNYGEEKHEML